MATVQGTDLADLVAVTLRELGRFKIQQIAQPLQHYEVFPKWFKKDKVTFDDGYGIQKNLATKMLNCAAHVGLMDEDDVNIEDFVKQLHVDWVQARTNWGVIYQETLYNRGPSRIYDLIKGRREMSWLALIDELENRAWASPTGPTDVKVPFGLPYWVTKVGATSTPGFTGGLPTGFTTVGGVSLTDVTTFKNYNGLYVTPNKPDLISKMRDMHWYTGFQSPVDMADYRSGKGEQYRVYVNRATMGNLEAIGEAQNENLGRDLASIDGFSLAFRGHPIRCIAKLEADTANPVYFIDHSTFYPVCLKGDYFRESRNKSPKQHNIEQMFVDLSYNYVCVDRRRNGVLSLS